VNQIVPYGSVALIPQDMNGAIRLAELMSTGRMIPSHLQKSPGDCLMVVEQAMRWGMSPFAVAQCTSVIHGRLMFEGKLVAAALQSSGILADRLDYEFSGEGAARAITVRATLRGETQQREVTVTLKEAKTENGMWVKQPDQQLVYHGTRVWARRHAPEVMLGVYSPEETDAPVRDSFRGTTLDAKPERDARDSLADSIPEEDTPPAPPTAAELRERVDRAITAMSQAKSDLKLTAIEANAKGLVAALMAPEHAELLALYNREMQHHAERLHREREAAA
jgi:hypothetical protein